MYCTQPNMEKKSHIIIHTIFCLMMDLKDAKFVSRLAWMQYITVEEPKVN